MLSSVAIARDSALCHAFRRKMAVNGARGCCLIVAKTA